MSGRAVADKVMSARDDRGEINAEAGAKADAVELSLGICLWRCVCRPAAQLALRSLLFSALVFTFKMAHPQPQSESNNEQQPS